MCMYFHFQAVFVLDQKRYKVQALRVFRSKWRPDKFAKHMVFFVDLLLS